MVALLLVYIWYWRQLIVPHDIFCPRQILSLSDGERITSIVPVKEFTEDQFLLMLSANGYIKKVSLNSFSSIRSTGIIAIQLVSLLFLSLLPSVFTVKSWSSMTKQTYSIRFLVMSWNGFAFAQMMISLLWLPKMEWSSLAPATS